MENVIYKYLPIERLSYLEDELLRITQPGDLNDPFECLPSPPSIEVFTNSLIEIRKTYINSINKGQYSAEEKTCLIEKLFFDINSSIRAVKTNKPNNLREVLYKRAINTINNSMGIISLSKRWDSTLMWSHYTNSHKGFCVGFDTSTDYFKLYEKFSNDDKIYLPVIYSNNRIKIPINKQGDEIDVNVVLTKSTDWEYEQEKRLIIPLKQAHAKIKKSPFDIYLYKMPHHLIKEIIVGANIENENLSIIQKFCVLKDIELYHSKLSETKFDMIRAKI